VIHDPYGDDRAEDSRDLDGLDDDEEEHEVDDLILTDDCNSWHVERGSDRFTSLSICTYVSARAWIGS
jgi:hypothetical protein